MMAAVNPQPLQSRPFQGHEDYMQIPIQIDGDGGGYEVDDIDGGGEEIMYDVEDVRENPGNSVVNSVALTSRMSELTLSFEGEVYVFHAVTPQKVQAVLLLLGGQEIPSTVPTIDVPFLQNNRGACDAMRSSNLSRRIASLVRFREKRKERCFDKKIRYNCRKEVAQRMLRKNGQFASLKEGNKEELGATASWDPSQSFLQDDNTSPHPEIVERKCKHCGIGEKSTPAMRRGPAGPRSLCNACGLMWANKGTLRDLTKNGRHISSDQNEPETPGDTKALTLESENFSAKDEQKMGGIANSLINQDEQASSEDMKPLPRDFGNHSVGVFEQGTREDLTKPLAVGVEKPSADLDEESALESAMVAQSLWGDLRVLSSNFWDLQGIPNNLSHVSTAEIDIPANQNEQPNDPYMDGGHRFT